MASPPKRVRTYAFLCTSLGNQSSFPSSLFLMADSQSSILGSFPSVNMGGSGNFLELITLILGVSAAGVPPCTDPTGAPRESCFVRLANFLFLPLTLLAIGHCS